MNKVCNRKNIKVLILTGFMSRMNLGKLLICYYFSKEPRITVDGAWLLIMNKNSGNINNNNINNDNWSCVNLI